MAYTAKARALRRCQARTKAGASCAQWAVWGDELNRCAAHGGRVAERHVAGKTSAPVCQCSAWNFPHRPGSGPCRWPDPPLVDVTVHKTRDRAEKRMKRGLTREPLSLFLYRLYHHDATWLARWHAAQPWREAE